MFKQEFPWTLGVDEAGRGCLAGPVVAAAVLLPPRYDLNGLADSKTLTPAKRQQLALSIRACALSWGLGLAWQGEVDQRNILQATFWAMTRSLKVLRPTPLAAMHTPLLLIDGNKTIPEPILAACLGTRGSATPLVSLPRQQAVVDGDALEPCISAASILAKTFRDHLMKKLHARYPQYGFAKHKGYGTKEHVTALREHGPCPLHRLTFGKVLPPPPQNTWGKLL